MQEAAHEFLCNTCKKVIIVYISLGATVSSIDCCGTSMKPTRIKILPFVSDPEESLEFIYTERSKRFHAMIPKSEAMGLYDFGEADIKPPEHRKIDPTNGDAPSEALRPDRSHIIDEVP